MIIGIGTDIIEISRIRDLTANVNFYKKMFTDDEIEYLIKKQPESTAGYFCAKEAVAKALGTGFSGFDFTDIEILKKGSAPFVKLYNKAQAIADEKGISEIHISISHCRDYATAVAVAEETASESPGSGISVDYTEYPLNIMKVRKTDSHKGDYGKVFVIGGSHNMSGAVVLTARAALRSGAGLVTCVIPESIMNRVASHIIEATFMGCNEKNGYIDLTITQMDEILSKCDAVAFGIGLGKTNEIKNDLEYIIRHSTKPVVIDADGINVLQEIKGSLKDAECEIVITPHTMEMSRLTGLEPKYIDNNRLKVAREFAAIYNCTVLLKGNHTIVTDGTREYENHTGNPGMATGGSGDVLTGIIISLIGQGYNVYDSAVLGAYIHGRAGDSAYERYGVGLTAGDMTDFLGNYLKR